MSAKRHGPFDLTYVVYFLGLAAVTLFVNLAVFASTAVLILALVVLPITAYVLWRHR
jgi:hypothetical protein